MYAQEKRSEYELRRDKGEDLISEIQLKREQLKERLTFSA
jgi:hypothetical protein